MNISTLKDLLYVAEKLEEHKQIELTYWTQKSRPKSISITCTNYYYLLEIRKWEIDYPVINMETGEIISLLEDFKNVISVKPIYEDYE